MIKIYVLALFCVMASGVCRGQNRVCFNDEKADTTRLVEIMLKVNAQNITSEGERLVALGMELLGTPYVAGTLEGEEECVRINTDGVDCTTFVELVLSMGKTLSEGRSSWRDVVYNLEKMRYRHGECDGYASRLHYISDWIVDNSFRGNLEEVTTKVGKADYTVKTLDFISSNRDKYAALKNQNTLDRLKEAEVGYRSHRFPYLKRENVKSAKLENGDVVAFTTGLKGLDVTHIGIIVIRNGEPHLMHASTKAGKVIVESISLNEYLRKNQKMTGLRVVRLKN